jgi:AcrR family transcriptional regulator
MPPRPSRNVDQLLLQAGHELLPETGVRGLSIRQVAERAGVNLGMFHYHFKTKDVFVRAVLQQQYNEMFATLAVESNRSENVLENLRGAANTLARFARDHRKLLVRLLNDALAGEAVAQEFLAANMPRHIHVVAGLIAQSQKDGLIKKLPVPQALAFLMGSVGAPILLGAAVIQNGLMPVPVAEMFQDVVFSNAAIAERVDMALTGLAEAGDSAAKAPARSANKNPSGARK